MMDGKIVRIAELEIDPVFRGGICLVKCDGVNR